MLFNKYNLILKRDASFNFNDQGVNYTSPRKLYDLGQLVFSLDAQAEEVIAVVAFDTQARPIAAFEVARGAVDHVATSPREIFKRLMLANAFSWAIMHNHPSGNLVPSTADKDVTQELIKGSEILDLPLVDHVIISHNGYTSLRSNYPEWWK